MKKIYLKKAMEKKKEYFYIAILIMIPILWFLFIRSGGYLAGSKVDWISQHSVFPEYFRELFYKTKNLFPQYSAALGGGQNIWNFAYYGLYNPIYWLSYLMPWMKMRTYLQLVMVLVQISNGILCYVWLKSCRGNKGTVDNRNANAKGNPHAFCAFSATLFLTLSAPVIYHSATQIMFVDYLPFLLISLIGYDRYTRQKKYDFLVVGVVLMILTSFYFAIGGLVVIFIYGITDLEKEEICSVRGLICKLWLMFYPLLIGVLLTAFYLVPTYLAMRGGRSEKHNYSWSQLFLPDFNVSRLVHSPYGIGITAIGLIVLCTSLFYKRSREKWLGVCLIILFYIPVFTWVLNGGLYLRAKVFIPFLPLICYLVMD